MTYPLLGVSLLPILILLLVWATYRMVGAQPVGGWLLLLIGMVATLIPLSLIVKSTCHDPHRRWAARAARAASILRIVQHAQETHFEEGGEVYSDDPEALGLRDFEGVDVEILSGDAGGFGATVRYDDSPELICSVWVGEAHRVGPATEGGHVACTPSTRPRWCATPLGALGG